MNFDIKDGLYETVICNEFQKYAEKHKDTWDELAKYYAVEMLEEIKFILDDAQNFEELHSRIMKVVFFMDTPPYPQRRKPGDM